MDIYNCISAGCDSETAARSSNLHEADTTYYTEVTKY
jgi:hypothetical protein